ncbi:MAG: GlcG/HbpS family heme-binding protein [Dichotomicrobium sp.]
MSELTRDAARTIIETAFAKGRELGLKPLAVAILDAGGHLKAFEREDGTSFLRPKIAFGKAYGSIALGAGSRALHNRAEQQAYFINAVNALADGNLVPVAGGVVIRDAQGAAIGAVGVTGDTSENDEACALAGIEAAGFKADTGA